MSLNLDKECQTALDLAKRALPEGSALDPGLLMAALFHSTALKRKFPQLAPYLGEPVPRRADVPEKVPVAEPVQAVLRQLAAGGTATGAEDFFKALVRSDAGRQHLASLGLPANELAAVAGAAPASASAPPPPNDTPPGWRSSSQREDAIKALTSFGRMLTQTEPPHRGVVEMEIPLRSLVRTLSKMGRRNAIVVGYPGTGKSALIYELARRIVRGDSSIPARLRDCDIFELSPTFLRSGASMVGQYEERVKSLLEILKAHPKIILFIDEIHSMFQSGMQYRGPFSDANEAFKSALASGDISCIGCTTTAEYRHYIEPDGALQRRFGIIRLSAPTAETALRILQARRKRLEDYYAPLRISDEILERTVALTEEHLPGRFQPDKSIQLLDEACAHCATMDPPAGEVAEPALWQALEDMTGHTIARLDRLTETQVIEKLCAKIIGQDETLQGIARAFIAGLGGWAKRAAPRGVFFFCGPTGVGKTETAALLGSILGAGREALIRVDCNTLQGSGYDSGPAINRLLGAPPGYIGYTRGQGGLLSKIRDMPESVVLFDEIEKADPGVGKLLLQILDTGRIEDNDENVLDFRRSYLIFTTNAGCVYDRKGSLGFKASGEGDAPAAGPRVDLDTLKAQLRALGYGEEFLARIRHYFAFQSLGASAIAEVVGKQLERLREAAELRGHELEWEPEVVEYLSSQWQPRFGVRHMTTVLRNRISEQLSVADAQGELEGVRRILLRVLRLEGVGEGRDLAGLAARERRGDTMVIGLS
jgi:ATP-dependent Clp protease ATP-binding subunit ClpA